MGRKVGVVPSEKEGNACHMCREGSGAVGEEQGASSSVQRVQGVSSGAKGETLLHSFFQTSLPPLGKINACAKYLKAPISLPPGEKA